MNYSKKYNEDNQTLPNYITGDVDTDMLTLIKEINDSTTASLVNNTGYMMQRTIIDNSDTNYSTAYYALMNYYDEFLMERKLCRKKPGDGNYREYLPCVSSFLTKQEAIRATYKLTPSGFLDKWRYLEGSGRVPATQVDQMVDRISTEVGSPISKQYAELGMSLKSFSEHVKEVRSGMEQMSSSISEQFEALNKANEDGANETKRLIEELKKETERNRESYEEQLREIKKSISDLDNKEDHERQMELMKAANEELNRKNEELLQKINLINTTYTNSLEEIVSKLSEMDAFISGYKKGMFSKDTWKESSRVFLKDMELSIYKAKDAIQKNG